MGVRWGGGPDPDWLMWAIIGICLLAALWLVLA